MTNVTRRTASKIKTIRKTHSLHFMLFRGFLYQARCGVPLFNEPRALRPVHGFLRTERRSHRFRDTYFRNTCPHDRTDYEADQIDPMSCQPTPKMSAAAIDPNRSISLAGLAIRR